MKRILNATVILLIIAFSIWLFFNEKAAEPGSLSSLHNESVSDCKECHTPWKGVSEDACLACHDFFDVSYLRPDIRFHEEQEHCLKCHTEHRGLKADVSRMDHTLLSGDLECSQCHLDRHRGLFGSQCRECHGIRTWKIEGFRHPAQKNRQCHRCHRAPESHYDEYFWGLIEESHYERYKRTGTPAISVEDCWLCHAVRHWPHLIMEHEF